MSNVNTTAPQNKFIYPYHSLSIAESLISTARALVHPRGKGIYATDEDPAVIGERLVNAHGDAGKDKVWTEKEKVERRRRWRECLYESAPTDYISGVILYPETLHDFQLAPILSNRGIIPGVRANGNEYPILSSPAELETQGLDDLLPRLQAAHQAGARFSKFRASFRCTSEREGLPTNFALELQTETLARFAAASQQAGLVPILEPDVDFDEDADLARSAEVHRKIISLIYAKCAAHGVLVEGSLIKPSFPQPGLKNPSRGSVSPKEIAVATATVLSRSLPVAVPGVVFLSGGLSDAESTAYLYALNALIDDPSSAPPSPFARLPPLSFSFGRGLQGDAMAKWVRGDEEGAKKAFEERARACWKAVKGVLD